MIRVETPPPDKQERRWCLCLTPQVASFGLASVYLVVNLAAIATGLIYLAATHGQRVHEPVVETSLLTGILVSCFICCINVIACALLLVGVQRRRWELVTAWLAWYGIFQALLTLAWVGGVVHLVRQVAPAAVRPADADFSWSVLVPLLPVGIIVLVFVWYAYAAVVAHCRRLRADADAVRHGDYSVIRHA